MPGATTLNPSTREPLSEQLRQINLNQENIVKIMEAIQSAVTGEAAFVQTDVEDVNGNTTLAGTAQSLNCPGLKWYFHKCSPC